MVEMLFRYRISISTGICQLQVHRTPLKSDYLEKKIYYYG